MSNRLTSGLLALALAGGVSASPVLAQADPDERSGHATRVQNPQMLRVARYAPERFLGRLLLLSDGRKAGDITAIRRNKEDSELYLIVEAEPYFGREQPFAVPVLDVDRFEGDTVILTRLSGNFLRGIEYDPAEFEDMDASFEDPVIVDE